MIKEFINRWRIKSAERLTFSGRRAYFFRIKLKIKPDQDCKKFEVWLPLPAQTNYQDCSKIEFPDGEPTVILTDSVFKNKVAYWQVEGPKGTYQISQESRVWVKPRVVTDIAGSLEDYDKSSAEYKLFVKNDSYFHFSDPRVNQLAQKLQGQTKQISQIVRSLYDYVRDNLVYGDQTEGLYSSIDALERAKVDCGGFDCLLGALYRCVGIPARLLNGFLVGYPQVHMHAWLEFMTPGGEWMPADPANDNLRINGRDFKPGGFGRVGNDRIVVSAGSDISLSGKKFPLLQLPIVESAPAGTVSVERSTEALELK